MRRLTDLQLEEAESRARLSGIPLSTCPTCLSTVDSYGERQNGIYRLDGQEFDCNCQEQIRLRQLYLYSNIPASYYHLDWQRDFNGSKKIKGLIQDYIDNWDNLKLSGIGLELSGGTQGTGKTMAAVTLAKYLVREKGENVYFCEFSDLLNVEFQNQRILDSNVLILDEVKKPYSDRQKDFFASKFEDLIRTRNNWQSTTIFTTNMLEKDIVEFYTRAVSLLREKQIRVDFTGEDYRSTMGKLLLERAANGEKCPIS